MLSEGESFREFMEEYDQGKNHDRIIANHVMLRQQQNETFEKLQVQIRLDNDEIASGSSLTDEDYNLEIDTIMELCTVHRIQFTMSRPTVAEWKKRRLLYRELNNAEE